MPLSSHDYANENDNVLFQVMKNSRWDRTRRLLGILPPSRKEVVEVEDEVQEEEEEGGHTNHHHHHHHRESQNSNHTTTPTTTKGDDDNHQDEDNDDASSNRMSLVQQMDRYGNTALHTALGYQAPDDVIHRLIGLYPNATTVHGTDDWTPLHVASMYGCSTDVFAALVRANPYALDDRGQGGIKGRTPRHFRHRFPATLQPLLDRSTEEWIAIIQREQQQSEQQQQSE